MVILYPIVYILSRTIDNLYYLVYYVYMFKDVLKDSGLENKEPIVYDSLLHLGDSPASEIINHSGLKRGIVYKTLDDLEEKGLVKKYQKNKKTYFKPEHPYKLSEIVESELQEAQNHKLTLQTYLPQILSTFNVTENKPGVKVFEGIEGIKEVYKDTLLEKPEEIMGILQTSEVEPAIYKWLTTHYAPQRAKEGIWAKVITTTDKKLEQYIDRNEEEKRETRVVPKKKFPVAIEMNIYGNKVAFMNFKKGESHIGIIINNKLIADTMRALFSLAWEDAERYTTTIQNA